MKEKIIKLLILLQFITLAIFGLILHIYYLPLLSLFLLPLFLKGKASREERVIIKKEVDNELINKLHRESCEIKEEKEKLSMDVEKAFIHYKMTEATLNNTEQMSRKVISIVQDRVNNLTNDIFSLTSNSQDISQDINSMILSVTHGNDSLEKAINNLNLNIDGIDSITGSIHDIGKVSLEESKAISETFLNVKNYTKNITDLAEQTGVLAINATIEAARSGVYGKGFAVIAGEVRKLADDSKKMAETINSMINDTYNAITVSFNKQHERVVEAGSKLEGTKRDIKGVSDSLMPKIEVLSSSINKSSSISEEMTDKLNNFTNSIQFLDLVRQIIEHIMMINREIWSESQNDYSRMDIDEKEINESVINIMTKHFTSKEEWDALGLQMRGGNSSKKENLKGDVTLF